jgi:LacI family transcriptional regulator
MGKAKRVGVMMQLDRPFKRHVSVYEGILAYARNRADWHLVIDEWADSSLSANRGDPPPYDGIVGRIGTAAAARARRVDVPIVNVWLSSPAKGLPGVFPDYAASGKLVADHLLGRGFRYLAAFLETNDKGTALQVAAMKKCAEEAVTCAGWIGTVAAGPVNNHGTWLQVLKRIERWMDGWKLPIGLLVRDPVWARVIIERAQERGWLVPQQVAVVCSHNDELYCEHPEPGLTALELPDERIGSEAAALLDGLIDRKRRGKSPFADPETLILPPMGIVSRQSTDFFTVDDPFVGGALRFIAENLHRPLDVARVAKAVGTSRRALDDRFRKSLGVTVVAEIMRLRIERVKRELAAGQDTIDAIALRTGFASTRTLNDQFLRSTGMSPSAFREQGTRPTG